MRPRSELQAILEDILQPVYFQPPTNIQMTYPCIVYKRDDIKADFSGNRPYNRTKRYMVTVIDRDPDSTYHEAVGALPMSAYDRSFVADDLNHDVYNIFF